MAQIVITGNVGKITTDTGFPELHIRSNGDRETRSAFFSIGWSERIYNSGARTWEQSRTQWVDVACFGALAEEVSNAIQQGMRVTVVGDMIPDESHYNNQTYDKLRLKATEVAVSVMFQDVAVTKRVSQSAGGASDPWGSQPRGGFGGGEDQPPF